MGVYLNMWGQEVQALAGAVGVAGEFGVGFLCSRFHWILGTVCGYVGGAKVFLPTFQQAQRYYAVGSCYQVKVAGWGTTTRFKKVGNGNCR